MGWNSVICFFGDFMQIAPIADENGEMAAIHASFRLSPLWDDDIKIVELTHNYRQNEDPEYLKDITNIGLGNNTVTSGLNFEIPSTSTSSSAVKISSSVTLNPDDLITHASPCLRDKGM